MIFIYIDLDVVELNLQVSSFGEKYDFIIGIKNTSEIIVCSRDIIFTPLHI